MDQSESTSAPFTLPTAVPVVHQETWLPGLLLAVCGGVVTAAGLLLYIPQEDGRTPVWSLLIAAAFGGYGCLIGYANQRTTWSRAFFWLPWSVFVLRSAIPLVAVSPMPGLIYTAVLALPILLRLGATSHPIGALVWGLAIASWIIAVLWWLLAMLVGRSLGPLFLWPFTYAAANFLTVYVPLVGGLFAGCSLRLTIAGRREFLESRPVDRILPTRFGLMSIFAATTAAAITLTIVILYKLPMDWIGWAIPGACLGAALGIVWARWYPNVPDGPGIVREPLPPWIDCPQCHHVARHRHARCQACGSIYPIEERSAKVEASPEEPVSTNPEPESHHDWTV